MARWSAYDICKSALACSAVSRLSFHFLPQVNHLAQVVVEMGGATQKDSKSVSSVFHSFCGVSCTPIRAGLFGDGVLHHDHGSGKCLEQVFFGYPVLRGEFQVTIANVARSRDVGPNIKIQVAGEVKEEMPNAVAIGIRAGPNLVIGERLKQGMNFFGERLIVPAEVRSDVECKVGHYGNSSTGVVLRTQGSLEDLCHEPALGLIVCLPVVPELPGQVALQACIGPGFPGVSSKVVSERDMPPVFLAGRQTDVKVMSKIVQRGAKSFTAGDT